MKPLFLILILLISCATLKGEKKFKRLIKNNKCEEATKAVPIDSTQAKIFKHTKQVIGTTTSYTLSISASILGLLAGISINGDPRLIIFGPLTYEKTFEMRCYEVDNIVLALNEIGKCYYKRKNLRTKRASIKFLEDMQADKEVYKCATSSAQKTVKETISVMKKKLSFQ